MDIARDLALRDACKVTGAACDSVHRGLNAALATYASGAAAMSDPTLSPAANAGVVAERNQDLALGNDPGIAAQSLLDSFKEFAMPQLAGYAISGALGAYINEARAIYAAVKAESVVAAPATSGGMANSVSGRLLAEDLAAQQRFAPQVGTTLPGATKPITVTAETEIGGVKLFDTNQTARPMTAAQASEPTLISNQVSAGQPNGTMGTAHAEVAVIQRASDAGLTRGQDMTIVVRGQEVCRYCTSTDTGLTAMAEAAGLKSLTVVDTVGKRVLNWKPGQNRFLVGTLHP